MHSRIPVIFLPARTTLPSHGQLITHQDPQVLPHRSPRSSRSPPACVVFGVVPPQVLTLNPALSKPPVIAPARLQDGARGLGTPLLKVEFLFFDGLRGERCPGQPERRVIDVRGLRSWLRWEGSGSHPAPCIPHPASCIPYLASRIPHRARCCTLTMLRLP